MLLAVDIGNTNTKFRVYDGHDPARSWIVATSQIRERAFEIAGLDIDGAIICSVVPSATQILAVVIRSKLSIDPTVIASDQDLGIRINYDPPGSLGADRAVNAASAFSKYGGPILVSSHGTALTLDLVTAQGELLGGVIAPGIRTLALALDLAAEQLPAVEISKPVEILQDSTVGAIRSGVFFGYISMFEGLVERIRDGHGHGTRVVATGGMAETVAANTPVIDMVDTALTLDGLRMLSERFSQR